MNAITQSFEASRQPFEFPALQGVVSLVKATLFQNNGRGRGNLPDGYVSISLPRLRCIESFPKFSPSAGGDLR